MKRNYLGGNNQKTLSSRRETGTFMRVIIISYDIETCLEKNGELLQNMMNN